MSKVKNIVSIHELPVVENVQLDELKNSYMMVSTHVNAVNHYVDYKLKFEELCNQLTDLSKGEITDLSNAFYYFINNINVNSFDATYLSVSSQVIYDENNKDYSYIFSVKPNIAQITQNESKYIDTGDDINVINSYGFTENGLVDAFTLQDYVMSTIERILGIPTTPEAEDNAINTIKEFIDWFNGYVTTDDSANSLHNLISNIEEKDQEVLNAAKNYASQQANSVNTRINTLNVPNIGGAEKFISEVSQSAGKITATAKNISDISINTSQVNGLDAAIEAATLEAGDNIFISNKKINCNIGINSDNNKSFMISNNGKLDRFLLQMDNNGKLFIDKQSDPYITFTFTRDNTLTPANLNLEINTDPEDVTIKGTPNKACKVSGLTNLTGATVNVTTINSNTPITVTGTYDVNTSSKTFTIKVKENDLTQDEISFGHSQAEKSLSTTVKYNLYKVMVFCSPNDINNITIQESETANISSKKYYQPIAINTNGKTTNPAVSSISTSPVGSFTLTTSGYLYFLLPTSFIDNSKSIKWEGNEAMGDTPGNTRKRIMNLYNVYNESDLNNSTSYKEYTLFRSAGQYIADSEHPKTINLKYE